MPAWPAALEELHGPVEVVPVLDNVREECVVAGADVGQLDCREIGRGRKGKAPPTLDVNGYPAEESAVRLQPVEVFEARSHNQLGYGGPTPADEEHRNAENEQEESAEERSRALVVPHRLNIFGVTGGGQRSRGSCSGRS